MDRILVKTSNQATGRDIHIKMNKLIIKEELKWLIEAINEQFATVREYEDRIPQIEFDILMENVRKFYDDLRKLQRINDMHLLPEPVESHGSHKVLAGPGGSVVKAEPPSPKTFAGSGNVQPSRSSVQGPQAGQSGFSPEKTSPGSEHNTGSTSRYTTSAGTERPHDHAGETMAEPVASASALPPDSPFPPQQTDDATSQPGTEGQVRAQKPRPEGWNESPELQKAGPEGDGPMEQAPAKQVPEPVAGTFLEPVNLATGTPSEPYPSFKVTFEPPAHAPKEQAAPPKKPKKQPEIDLFAAAEPEFSIKLKEAREKTLPKAGSTRIDNLRSAITINDKFMFINELFDGNLREYNETIETLNGFKTLDQAGDYLDLMRRKNFWDTGSNAFKKLQELVEKKF